MNQWRSYQMLKREAPFISVKPLCWRLSGHCSACNLRESIGNCQSWLMSSKELEKVKGICGQRTDKDGKLTVFGNRRDAFE